MKTCTKCKIEKPKSDFHKNSQSKSGIRPNCKACEIERKAKYRSNNIDSVNARCAVYRNANREKVRASNAAYKASNPEKINAIRVAWVSTNSVKVKAGLAKWKEANRDRVRELNAAWNASHPEVMAAISRNRRARDRNADGSHTNADVKLILLSQNNQCANCKATLILSGKKKYHVDHVMPLALGGSNWPSNLQCLCQTCNLRKSSKHPDDWANENGRLL